MVRDKLNVSAKVNKRIYDKKVRELQFKENDTVHVYVPKKVKGRNPKLQMFYKDIGAILKKINDTCYLFFARVGVRIV